jgi:hypothetical protein
MSDEERCFFVQFPHPGGEHNPPTDIMPWNVHDHRRKFLRAQGRYLGHDGRVVPARLVLWGEWEPPSRVVQRWPKSGRLPRALHEPYWATPQGTGFRQNTDPWVWGKNMFYSCCKQTVGDQRSATAMQRLTRGSVICFGSTMDGAFCLDTVFVVASAEPWTAVGASELQANDAFIICTAGSIANSPDARVTFTLYRGATFDRPVGSMFSFVPALRADDEAARFPRPSIKLPGLVNPMSRQSTWGSRRPLDVDTVASAWSAVKDQVVGAGLGLAVSLDVPPREARIQPLQIGTRTRC